MRRSLALAAGLVLAVLTLAPPAGAGTYDPAGIYLDFLTRDQIAEGPGIHIDADGVPTLHRGDAWVYNPVTISQYGLQEYSRFVTSADPADLARARQAGDWLVSNQDATTGAWFYDYAFDVSGMDETLAPHWTSAMAQGQAMSLLTRLSRATGEPKYAGAAMSAATPLHKSVTDGGLTADFSGHPFYEEYPTDPPSFTLNGFMFTLIGLYDLDKLGGSTDAGQLYSDGMATLDIALPYFDTGGVSAYHLGFLTKPPRAVHASLKYHWIHVTELEALNSVSPSPVLQTYHDKWAAYVEPLPPPPRPSRPAKPRAPAGPSVPADTVAPAIRSLKALFRGRRVSGIRLRLTEPSRLHITLTKRCRRHSGHCKPRRPYRVLDKQGRRGLTVVRFPRADGRLLWRGAARLRLIAIDAAGNRSAITRLPVRRPRR